MVLITESHVDIETSGGTKMRVFLFHPVISGYPNAKFPGVVVWSEIYQVTGPVSRFARQIAGQGYICAAPSVYHDFEGPAALAYDVPGTDKGNEYKIKKTVASYDEDAKLTVDYLLGLKTCTGKIGTTGMCLGGHLAFSSTLGLNKKDDSLARIPEIKGELAMIFGKMDNHVPPAGRDLIRKTLHEAGTKFSFYEFTWAQHAFIRDEESKGRYDPALSKICFEVLLELFTRTLKTDLGVHVNDDTEIEDVC
ncbi:uncharacterized protein H6S33_011316 [Morchella sextelata]|uniref:uncharacterized protein n=1 Tax=Morchella sextelata TaxID=1174677 RepID=UPI001D0538B7|nr:uncharacterized protein H6S33_011316 [Morchella sextelata]KAH0610889.1 hypothetical protein H6S33_011316 [Morchella sextelata]